MNNSKFFLDISWTTIFKILLVLVSLYLIYSIGDILIWLLFALIISMLFNPAIDFFEESGVPRVITVILCYGIAFSIIGLLVYSSFPIFLNEAKNFSDFFKTYFGKLSLPLRGLGIQTAENIESFIHTLEAIITKMSANIFNAISAIFGGIFSTIFVIVMGIFLSLEKRPIEKAISLLVPPQYLKEALLIWRKSQKKVSGWFLSRVVACLFVGVFSLISFIFLKIDYPFSLAFIGGVLNFLPFLGPLIAGILIFLVAALDKFFLAFLALIIYILIQQIENNFLSPILSKKFVGLSPVLVMIGLAVGGKLWGLMGAILAVPLLGILFEFGKEFLRMKRLRERLPKEDLLTQRKNPFIF